MGRKLKTPPPPKKINKQANKQANKQTKKPINRQALRREGTMSVLVMVCIVRPLKASFTDRVLKQLIVL